MFLVNIIIIQKATD